MDEDGYVSCPECGETIHFADGESHSEYTGGGFQDEWYEFVCKKCHAEFSSAFRSGYA